MFGHKLESVGPGESKELGWFRVFDLLSSVTAVQTLSILDLMACMQQPKALPLPAQEPKEASRLPLSFIC
ncbi:hypothetical protein IEQ34_011081 [Dendrobium chrysotoxum]|uniref:Uncharacterized protein n=1 Tax=Dendrobium chrysotoxum TaxID=161865 RepID=A0AAV7GXF6_DENCH|nr:hypothetical protein IEQ34_011081 [Dendrobium chrysotoxum]